MNTLFKSTTPSISSYMWIPIAIVPFLCVVYVAYRLSSNVSERQSREAIAHKYGGLLTSSLLVAVIVWIIIMTYM